MAVLIIINSSTSSVLQCILDLDLFFIHQFSIGLSPLLSPFCLAHRQGDVERRDYQLLDSQGQSGSLRGRT